MPPFHLGLLAAGIILSAYKSYEGEAKTTIVGHLLIGIAGFFIIVGCCLGCLASCAGVIASSDDSAAASFAPKSTYQFKRMNDTYENEIVSYEKVMQKTAITFPKGVEKLLKSAQEDVK